MDKQIIVIAALAEGSSIRSIERMTGVHRDTIMRLGVKVKAVYARAEIGPSEAAAKIYEDTECGNHGAIGVVGPGKEEFKNLAIDCDGRLPAYQHVSIFVSVVYTDILNEKRHTTLGYCYKPPAFLVRQDGRPKRQQNT